MNDAPLLVDVAGGVCEHCSVLVEHLTDSPLEDRERRGVELDDAFRPFRFQLTAFPRDDGEELSSEINTEHPEEFGRSHPCRGQDVSEVSEPGMSAQLGEHGLDLFRRWGLFRQAVILGL